MECLIRKHDDHQFEVKVAYPLQRQAVADRYALDMFIFLPYQLGVNADTCSLDAFFEDLSSYTRFKTPELSFEEINDAQNALSPLTRVQRQLESSRQSGQWDPMHLRYELRVLANVVRVQVRESAAAIRQRVRERASPDRRRTVEAAIDHLLEGLTTTLRRFRDLRGAFESPSAPPEMRNLYEAVDEQMSNEAEKLLLRLMKFLRKQAADLDVQAVWQRLSVTVSGETAHRRARGYPTVVSRDARRNERFLNRVELLKKLCASVLYLSEEKLPTVGRARQALYAIAAAIAMAFTVVAAWLVGRFYPTNSLIFALVAIGAYAFKDRIKDFLRDFSARLLPMWTSDRSIKLTDPQYGMEVGRTRENLYWLDRARLPEDVLKARQYRDPLEQAVAEPTEVVLHYAKKVRIMTQRIYRSHERSVAIDEILRLQVSRWLQRMDDPEKRLLKLRRNGDGVVGIAAARVYVVNLVIRLTSFRDRNVTLLRASLVLSRNGIERIET
ncbi:MAG: hypothetical protein ABSA67_12205 [Candidatus Brocadiia bacterium]